MSDEIDEATKERIEKAVDARPAKDGSAENELFIVDKIKEVSEIKSRYTPEQINFVKGLVNKDLTDTELFMFLAYANQLKLNPMNKEIIAIVYNGKHGRTVNTITTRDGKRVVATRTNELDGIITKPIYIKKITESVVNTDDPKVEPLKDRHIEQKTIQVEPWEGGILWGATSKVIRLGKEYSATVPFTEYDTGEYLWKSKPETMIKKVAESQALSMAFPEILTGLYDEAEFSEKPETPIMEPMEPIDDGKPATEEQKATIANLAKKKADRVDFEIPAEMTKVEAGKMIARLAQIKMG